MPRPRQPGAKLIRITWARAPLMAATTAPTTSSPTTATTADAPARTAEIKSETPNTGAAVPAAGSSHSRTTASRSSS